MVAMDCSPEEHARLRTAQPVSFGKPANIPAMRTSARLSPARPAALPMMTSSMSDGFTRVSSSSLRNTGAKRSAAGVVPNAPRPALPNGVRHPDTITMSSSLGPDVEAPHGIEALPSAEGSGSTWDAIIRRRFISQRSP